jgi:predicted  nucleic acid-binding Zn-ribbon protein
MSKVEERVERLESLLGQFIVNTDVALRRLEASLEAFKDEMRVFKDEMGAFKNEMKAFKDEMRAFKDEVNEDRKRMNKMWGELANKMGTLVEDIVAPNIAGIAERYFGCEKLDFFGIRIMKRNVKDEIRLENLML